MDSHDRYALVLALLEGDRDSRKILADLLEEQGDRGVAQWARSRWLRGYKLIEFAAMLLPTNAAIRFGCDAMQESFIERHEVLAPAEIIAGVRCWLLGEWTDAMVMDLCRQEQLAIQRSMPSVIACDPRRLRIVDAATCASRFLVLAVNEVVDDDCDTGHASGSMRCREHVRGIVRHCRPCWMETTVDHWGTSRKQERLDWLEDQLRSVLQQMLVS